FTLAIGHYFSQRDFRLSCFTFKRLLVEEDSNVQSTERFARRHRQVRHGRLRLRRPMRRPVRFYGALFLYQIGAIFQIATVIISDLSLSRSAIHSAVGFLLETSPNR